MKKFISIASTIVFLVMFSLWTNGYCATQNIYIDDNAPTGDGSIGDPYNAFSDINWSTGEANSIFDWVDGGDDVIINLARGDEWREQLTIDTSGASGHPVTIQAYGTGADPIINGANLVTEWSQYEATDIYSAACDWTATLVMEDSVLLAYETWDTNIATTAGNMEAGEWTLDTDNDLIYVWATDNADPDTHTMEVNVRTGIVLGSKNYLTIKDLHITMGGTGITTTSGNTNIIIQDCTINYFFGYGIAVREGTDWLISGNAISNCYETPGGEHLFGDGVYVAGFEGTNSDNIDIYNNTFSGFFERGAITFVGGKNSDITYNTFTSTNHWYLLHLEPNATYEVSTILIDNNTINVSGGDSVILVTDLGEVDRTIENITISNNSINSDIGTDDMILFSSDVGGTNYITGNSIEGTHDDTIYINGETTLTISGNIFKDGERIIYFTHPGTYNVFNNRTTDFVGGTPAFISASGASTVNVYYNVQSGGKYFFFGTGVGGTYNIYNNTVYNQTIYGFYCTNGITTIKNNIIYGTKLIYDETGAIVSDYNCFYPDGAGLFVWNSVACDDFADWKSDSSQDANSISADPLFVDAAGGNFALKFGSPCINAGVDLGATYDDAFDPRDPTFPYDTLDQDYYGDWEIGAFVYVRRYEISKRIKEMYLKMGMGLDLSQPLSCIIQY